MTFRTVIFSLPGDSYPTFLKKVTASYLELRLGLLLVLELGARVRVRVRARVRVKVSARLMGMKHLGTKSMGVRHV